MAIEKYSSGVVSIMVGGRVRACGRICRPDSDTHRFPHVRCCTSLLGPPRSRVYTSKAGLKLVLRMACPCLQTRMSQYYSKNCFLFVSYPLSPCHYVSAQLVHTNTQQFVLTANAPPLSVLFVVTCFCSQWFSHVSPVRAFSPSTAARWC